MKEQLDERDINNQTKQTDMELSINDMQQELAKRAQQVCDTGITSR